MSNLTQIEVAVAAAIREALQGHLTSGDAEQVQLAARAAIAAMLAPTEPMISAGLGLISQELNPSTLEKCWQAMIHAGLSERPVNLDSTKTEDVYEPASWSGWETFKQAKG